MCLHRRDHWRNFTYVKAVHILEFDVTKGYGCALCSVLWRKGYFLDDGSLILDVLKPKRRFIDKYKKLFRSLVFRCLVCL